MRRASVNSLGYGGTNAHIILENLGNLSKVADTSTTNNHSEIGIHQNGHSQGIQRNGAYRNDNGVGINLVHQNGYELKLQRLQALQSIEEITDRPLIVQISAKHEEAIQQMKISLSAHLRDQKEVAERSFIENLAFTLGQRRSVFSWSQAFPTTSVAGLIEALEDKKSKPSRSSKVPRLGFVFTGQGAQWAQMGRELITAYPVFKDSIDEANEYLMTLGCPWSLKGMTNPSFDHGEFAETYR